MHDDLIILEEEEEKKAEIYEEEIKELELEAVDAAEWVDEDDSHSAKSDRTFGEERKRSHSFSESSACGGSGLSSDNSIDFDNLPED